MDKDKKMMDTAKKLLAVLDAADEAGDAIPSIGRRIELDEDDQAEDLPRDIRVLRAPPGSTLVIKFERNVSLETLTSFAGHVERLGFHALILGPEAELKGVLDPGEAGQ